MNSYQIGYERRCRLLTEALKLAPLGEALQIAKSAEAFLTSDEHQAKPGPPLLSMSSVARSPYLN